MKKIFYYSIMAAIVICSISACKKYLDAKPNSKLATLNNLENLQSLLDDELRLNFTWGYAAEVAADDYYVTNTDLAALSLDGDRRMYNWEPDNVFQTASNGWYYAYLAVYYGNSILEALPTIQRDHTNSIDYDNIKGQAHFFKGAGMLHAAFVWCQAYQEGTAKQQLGLPIRTGTDFNIASVRSNLSDTYQQLISDLKQAATLLKVNQVHTMRSGKAAAFAMLSRAYLSMNKYTETTLYADSALQLNSQLLDYNTLNAAAENPFPQFKGEVLMNLCMNTPVILSQSVAKVKNELMPNIKQAI